MWQSILTPSEADDDSVPLLSPQSASRAGAEPQVINLPSLKGRGGIYRQAAEGRTSRRYAVA